MTRQKDITESGYLAHIDWEQGQPMPSNPHHEGFEEHGWWLEGWVNRSFELEQKEGERQSGGRYAPDRREDD